ncbi:unnamed protein product [Heligmosomoides polygyrus]|uniref:Uncharacterized protein n=1 Tax=Heligmosomoides polygyrus TaxID=6339 RepID=A0A183FW63_HELPZ|nr:unnamed protein product [Heligmosomoides polygyrus]
MTDGRPSVVTTIGDCNKIFQFHVFQRFIDTVTVNIGFVENQSRTTIDVPNSSVSSPSTSNLPRTRHYNYYFYYNNYYTSSLLLLLVVDLDAESSL